MKMHYCGHCVYIQYFHGSYLSVLVGCDCSESRLGETEGLEDAPADTEEIIGLHNVKTGLVAMHGVQNNLNGKST